MEAQDFLELVLPSQGNKVLGLVTQQQDGSTRWKYRAYSTVEELAENAASFDSDGTTVFFGVNSFGDFYHDEKKNRRRIRTQENVTHCRSLFDDFDVDPNEDSKYDTIEEAFADIIKLARALRLTPSITSSGGGYHAYFHLDEDIDVLEWEELSGLKRDITAHLQTKADNSVDMDIARVLRPIGVHNRKYDPPRQVELVKLGKAYSVETVRGAMKKYIADNNVQPVARNPIKQADKFTGFFGPAVSSFPPSEADKVAENCAAIREFRDSEGVITEPHWHRAIGVVKFCVDGEAKIHEWSKGHTDYSPSETDTKIAEWTVGPTSCSHMDSIVGCMADCPVASKCKSPIQLGYSDDAPSVASSTPSPRVATPTTIEGQVIPHWPKGFRWNGAAMERSITDDEGIVKWRSFCRSFAYPLNRVRDMEGAWNIRWKAKEKNGAWREFNMPTYELASLDLMSKTFCSNEVFLSSTRNARSDMADFAMGLIEKLQEYRVETKTYGQFGWTEDRTGFILGTTKITKDGEEEVLCDPTIPDDIAVDFGTSGTLDQWVANIDTLYNRPKAEPFQFALCHSMGSTLVEMFGSSNWHGLPMAFTGHGGTGKSTATKIACGFYGNPRYMERQTGDQGSTLNAAIKRIAVMGSVPVLLDEFSGRKPEELTRTGYALANGRDKERLKTNGSFATTGSEWFKNSFITSNDSLHESIATVPAKYRVEATQLRVFEVQLPHDYRSDVFPDITQSFIENHMDNVYGTPFRVFIRFLIENQDWVRRQIAAAREKFNPKSEEDNKERFYRDTIVTALVAGKIATKLGLIRFDIDAMKKWAVAHVLTMRDERRENNLNTSEQLALFIASLSGRLIITPRNGDGRTDKQRSMVPLRADAVGRVSVDDKVFWLSSSSIPAWCKDHGAIPKEIIAEMERGGYIIKDVNGGTVTRNRRLAHGTDHPAVQCKCYELDYEKLFEQIGIPEIQSGEETQP